MIVVIAFGVNIHMQYYESSKYGSIYVLIIVVNLVIFQICFYIRHQKQKLDMGWVLRPVICYCMLPVLCV